MITQPSITVIPLIGGTHEEIGHVRAEIGAAADEWRRLAVNSQELISEPLHQGLEQIRSASERVLGLAETLTGSIGTVAKELLVLPDRFVGQAAAVIEPAFERVAAQSIDTWRDLVRSVAVDLQRDYAEYVVNSSAEVARANAQMRLVSDEMNRLAQNVTALLTEPMKTAIETARHEASGALAELDNFVRDRYPAVKKDMDAFRKQMAHVTEALTIVERRLRELRFEVKGGTSGDSSAQVLIEIRDLLKKLQAPPQPRVRGFWSLLWPGSRDD